MPKLKAPKIEPELSKCCKAEIRTSDDGYGNQKPFCNACLLNIAPKKRVKKEFVTEVSKDGILFIAKDKEGLKNLEKVMATEGSTDHQLSKWHLRIRYALFFLSGLLVVMAYNRFLYDACVAGLTSKMG
jgi:hypothetical protein